jgi:hypothetical protein
MNMANTNYQDNEFDYQVEFRRSAAKETTSRPRRAHYGRANKPAVSHNGIHRRRNKRFTW